MAQNTGVKKKVGRPELIITPELIGKSEHLAAQGLNMEQIASVLGINVSTLYNKKAQFKELAEGIKRGRQRGIGAITNALFNKAQGGDNVAMIFYLKNRDPENWRDKRDHEVTGEGGGAIKSEMIIEFVGAKRKPKL